MMFALLVLLASIAFADYGESYTFEGPPRGEVQPDVPVGAPVAEALRARGQVALYIRFRSDSAELDAAATPALEELRDALRADPGLRLRLVGQGIAAGRLTTDGKGPDGADRRQRHGGRPRGEPADPGDPAVARIAAYRRGAGAGGGVIG